MSKPQQDYGQHFDVEDAFGGVLDGAAKLAFWGGIGAILIALGVLLYTYSVFATPTGIPSASSAAQAMSTIGIVLKLLYAGVVALIIGSTYMFWGEETLGPLQLIGAAALMFSPFYVPGILGSPQSETSQHALQAIQYGGQLGGVLAVLILLADISVRVRDRAKQGSRADQLKFGKGIKEERQIRNVFMGKCWQLPFCRQFVRERCPIYHSRRTCWKERVGCMCEEEVIRNAMESRVIPKDAVAAAKYIPVNNKLTMAEKAQRCRQCVIYNEHQKHKYRLAVPATLLGFATIYIGARAPLIDLMATFTGRLDTLFAGISFSAPPPPNGGEVADTTAMKQQAYDLAANHQAASQLFQNILLFCFMIVALAYVLKMLEYAIFKLKV